MTSSYVSWIHFSGCGGSFSGPSGTIESPSFPGAYSNDLNCLYQVTVDSGQVRDFFNGRREYRTLWISLGHIILKNSLKTPHSSPVGASNGVFLVSTESEQNSSGSLSYQCVHYRVITVCPTIYSHCFFLFYLFYLHYDYLMHSCNMLTHIAQCSFIGNKVITW